MGRNPEFVDKRKSRIKKHIKPKRIKRYYLQRRIIIRIYRLVKCISNGSPNNVIRRFVRYKAVIILKLVSHGRYD